MFIKYLTNQIPPKKSRWKGLKGKKTAEESQETVDVSEESELEPEPAKKKTSSKRRVKKKVTLSADDNIISDDPDAALELAKNWSKLGVLDESTIVSATSSEGTGTKPGVLDKDKYITKENVILEWGDEQDSKFYDDDNDDVEKDDTDGDADDKGDDHVIDTQDGDDEDVETESDEMIFISEEKVTDATKEEAKNTSEVKDDTKKFELPPSGSSLSVSLGFGDQFLKLPSDSSLISTVKGSTDTNVSSLLDIPIRQDTPSPMTPIFLTIKQTPTPILTQPITTDAPTITTAIPESDALSTVELRVAKLEKDVLELKTVDHSFKALTKHKADLIHKYSLQHLPELTKKPIPTAKQESERSPSNILKIKKEQAKSQKNLHFTIKSTDKVALEDYDLKSSLYQSMHANKSFNKNPANHQLSHALIEALIKDENAMDKEVDDTVKDHKRKHDDKDDDDEDPPAGPNQGKKTKRRRTKESESSKKSSSTKETPKGKTLTKGSKTAHDDNPPQDTSEPKTRKTLNPDWFNQPLRPFTPDPKGNKHQYALNGLKIENLTQDILFGPAFNLLKGTCSSSIELGYNLQECFNALIDNLDWNNPEGDHYLFDLSKPLPLQGPSGNIHHIYYEDKGCSISKFSKKNIYSTKAILGVKSVSLKKLHGYGHLEEIMVKRFDQQLYKFKEGDFVNLHLNDIEDMLFHLYRNVIVDFIMAIRMFTKSLILKRRVEELQLSVESYQKKLNITKPQKTFPEIEFKEPYTPSYDPPRIVYEDLNKQKRVMQADELYKFSDGTLKSVHDEIYHRVLDFHPDYNPEMPKRN
uniref:Uncharacterized protein n=1 Tax=Tanacetum cinerariifolium TaxID=118510 RepID=A0A6L2LN55_TANCI|nr:hypothetical protein [Tanacetum cinerariifolium]